MLPSIAGHVGDNTLTSNHQVGGKKGQVNIPCWLCEKIHNTYLFPCMDEASKSFEDIVISQQKPSSPSHELSSNQPLVDKVVGPIQSLIDPTLPLETKVDTTQVFLFTSYSSGQGGI
jgi:hypothetical protein